VAVWYRKWQWKSQKPGTRRNGMEAAEENETQGLMDMASFKPKTSVCGTLRLVLLIALQSSNNKSGEAHAKQED
jgi:hypothetical protein